MTERALEQYGLWPSAVTADTLATALRLDDVAWADANTLLWLEYRANRGVIVRATLDQQAPADLTDVHDVRARVGYGGGSMSATATHALYVERAGNLYRQSLDGSRTERVSPPLGRAASPCVSPDGRWVLFVHHEDGEDSLALCPFDDCTWPERLVRGADFYMQPTWHPAGSHIAWIEWDHPQMPWDGSRLCWAPCADGSPSGRSSETRKLAGDPTTSVSQPRFSPDGRLLAYLSDASGWSNLVVYDIEADQHRPLCALDAEFDAPAWVQGMRTYVFSADSRSLFAVQNRLAHQTLVQIPLDGGPARALPGLQAYTEISAPSIAPGTNRIACIASSPAISPRIVVWEEGQSRVIRRSTPERLAARDLASEPQAVQWEAPDGSAVHGLLFAPHSPAFKGRGRPPAVVAIHGGPTVQATAGYNPKAQFFATRGYAYLEVNYRGSSGYGRAYRRALQGQWGVVDVEDALGAGDFLADSAGVDPQRIVIMGGSAGGFTVLKALADHPGRFAAGLCLYGVSNLFTLAADTHKFEAHYLDSLVGKLPEASALYRERSPLFASHRIVDPIAIFQGTEDRVVPPDQSEAIVASLRARGVTHEYHLYEGEEHGFRNPATIRRFYEHVDRFLRTNVLFK